MVLLCFLHKILILANHSVQNITLHKLKRIGQKKIYLSESRATRNEI